MTTRPNPIPSTYRRVTPCLVVQGAAKALEFYADVFGATVNVGAAVSMRLIADPGDWDKTQMGIALGESGLNKSPHWTDQLADWRAVTPREFPFTTAAIAKATKATVVLEPAK